MHAQDPTQLRLALPKGRMERGVLDLMGEAGITVTPTVRGYRPVVSLPDTDTKVMKPQNIVEMLAMGRRDLGFVGADWVREMEADLVEVLDTGLDPVRVVAATTEELARDDTWRSRRIVVVSEYETLTAKWIARRELDAGFARSFGATEVFPPDDADVIVDNTATGSTLRANGLVVVDELLASSTRLCASRAAMADPIKAERIANLGMLLESVLDARRRVLLEVNVTPEDLSRLVDLLPCMRQPTVSPLFDEKGFAVKVAVPRKDLPQLIPAVRAAGGTDIVVSRPAQIVP